MKLPQTPAVNKILLITIDTIRPDALSCYGGSNHTPNLDNIARQGILFENAFCQVPLTFPSHVSILTGLYPTRHNMHHNGLQKFQDQQTSIAYLLRQSRYRTAAVVSCYVLDRKFGLNAGFDIYEDRLARQKGGYSGFDAERTADKTTDAALNVLSRLPAENWFLWVHYYDPHVPYSPPAPWKGYRGEVGFVDQQIGRLLKSLESKGRNKQLLLLIAADHGESLGEHGESTHGFFVYNSTMKIPLILSYDGSVKGARNDVNAATIDIVPTIMELTGIKDPLSRDGRSLISLSKTPRSIYFESLYPQLHGWSPMRGVLKDEWKLILTTRPELYQWKQDAQEKHDLYKKQPRIAAPLGKDIAALSRHVTKSVVMPDEETREKLESLGYTSSGTTVAGDSDPKDKIGVWTLYQEYLHFKNSGKQQQALKLLEKIHNQESSNPFFVLQLAKQYRESGNVSHAVDLLQKLAKRQTDADVHHELALALQKSGNPAKALDSLQIAIKQQPDRLEFRESLAILFFQTGKFIEAIGEMKIVLQADPNHASGWNNYGNILREAGKRKEAETAYGNAISLNPEYATPYNGLGIVMFEQRKVQESIRHLLKAVSLDPNLHDVYFNLGIAYEASGDRDKARSFYQKFLDVAPLEMQQQRTAAKQRLNQLR